MTTVPVIQEEEYTSRFNLAVWKKLFAYAWKYPRHVSVLCAAAVGLAVIDSALPYMMKLVIDRVADAGRTDSLLGFAGVYLLLGLAFALCLGAFIYLAGFISTRVSHDIRQDGFDKLQELSFSFYDRRPAGWLVARLTSDCDRLSRTVSWGVQDLIWGACLIVGTSAIMLWVDWKLALAVLAILPVMAWVSLVFQKHILSASRDVRKQNSNITASYSECIAGVRTTKTLSREDENLRDFRRQTAVMYDHSVRTAVLSSAFFPIVMTLATVASGLALWFGGNKAIAARLAGAGELGALVFFITSAMHMVFPVLEMARVLAEVQSAQAAAERVLGLIDTIPDVRDTPEVLAALAADGGGRPPGTAPDGLPDRIDRVQFENVSFAYNHGRPVLTDFNLTVPAGRRIALVGPTGGGKSTIVSLLARFYEPTAGRISIDGVEYRKRSLKWLQSNLGIVLQQPHLFSGTVRDNIRYGRLDATDEEVIAAARRVGAHAFIRELEGGYDCDVGEGGGRLSTGQKQLVSFARAVLADPQVFIMDEATSSVDTETEQLIQKGLQAVLEGRISFIIAHRLSTIRSADVILVIDDGKIVEQGDHAGLIALRGRYYELYTSQFAEEQTLRTLEHEDS